MRPITVAVAERDLNKRKQLEQFLKLSSHDITVLTDKDYEIRVKYLNKLSYITNTVTRIKQLEPRILFVNTHQLTKDTFDLLVELKTLCPNTLPIVLIKEQSEDNDILHALESGARGIVDCSKIPINVSKIIHTVNKGEPWVSRKILTKMMQKILLTSP